MARSGRKPDREIPGREILRVLVGSQAHGTADAESDRDERVVFVVPTWQFFCIEAQPRESAWLEAPAGDVTGWELGKFCKLASYCNPTVLEVLWGYVLEQDVWGHQLRSIALGFLSRPRIRDAFFGYASNQRKKMLGTPGEQWGRRHWKFAEAYLRVLFQGGELLRTGRLPVDLRGHPRIIDVLRLCREGRFGPGEVISESHQLIENIGDAYRQSNLPDGPDTARINQFVWDVRRQSARKQDLE